MIVTLPTAGDTHDFGVRVGRLLRAGDLVVLSGALGAGKTVLVQGIGAGMDVQGRIASPTFVIARVHPPRVESGSTLVHVDAYRLGSLAEVDDLDLDIDVEDVVTVVEWGAGLVEQLTDARLEIAVTAAPDADVRTATLTGHGGDWPDRLATLSAAMSGDILR